MDLNTVWQYITSNWFQMIIDGIAALNVLAAGARVMGWTQISDICGKLEDAITAMVQAAMNRKQNIQPTSTEIKS